MSALLAASVGRYVAAACARILPAEMAEPILGDLEELRRASSSSTNDKHARELLRETLAVAAYCPVIVLRRSVAMSASSPSMSRVVLHNVGFLLLLYAIALGVSLGGAALGMDNGGRRTLMFVVYVIGLGASFRMGVEWARTVLIGLGVGFLPILALTGMYGATVTKTAVGPVAAISLVATGVLGTLVGVGMARLGGRRAAA
jgi:hypothetical protein